MKKNICNKKQTRFVLNERNDKTIEIIKLATIVNFNKHTNVCDIKNK